MVKALSVIVPFLPKHNCSVDAWPEFAPAEPGSKTA